MASRRAPPEPCEVEIPRAVEKQLRRLSDHILRQIEEALNELRLDPLAGKPLAGPLAGKRSLRVGNHRIVYRYDESTRTVNVLDIADRREVYR